MITDAAQSIACPQCGAMPGEKCRDENGNLAPGVLTHKARADAWKAGRS